jgi:hypothetical protein
MATTWLMQAGVDRWEAAGFLGMSVEMLDRVYGHHHPDHLRSAARAIGYRPRQSLAESLARKSWWAREDSNLQPDRYERPALTIELRAPAAALLRLSGAHPIQCRARRDNAIRAGFAGRPGTRPACIRLAKRVRVLFVPRRRLSYA